MKKAKCTTAQFEGLHADLDKVRSTSKTVTINKDALRNLLLDHGTLWGGEKLAEADA